MKLSKECIEAIYEQIDESVSNRNDMILGCQEALTNPSIFEKAGLISLRDALGWVEFYRRTSLHDIATKSSPELFQIYQKQKQK